MFQPCTDLNHSLPWWLQRDGGHRDVQCLLREPRQPVEAGIERRIEDRQRVNVRQAQGFGIGEGTLEHATVTLYKEPAESGL